VVIVETLVSRLVIVHSTPAITVSVWSVTLPDIRAPSVCANATAEASKKIRTRAGDFIAMLRGAHMPQLLFVTCQEFGGNS
jgi:hypothetical protein